MGLDGGVMMSLVGMPGDFVDTWVVVERYSTDSFDKNVR